ncbi:MAG: hypothetical protein Q9217_000166 [Psora testacea]
MRASESILEQVDWSEVVLDAEGKKKPAIYRDFFKTIIQAHIKGLLKQEECRDIHIECGKRDDEVNHETQDIGTESGDDSSDSVAEEASQYFEDETFVESDEEGECASEDYADDANEDEEDEDDEDQEDDDVEVNDDAVSV